MGSSILVMDWAGKDALWSMETYSMRIREAGLLQQRLVVALQSRLKPETASESGQPAAAALGAPSFAGAHPAPEARQQSPQP